MRHLQLALLGLLALAAVVGVARFGLDVSHSAEGPQPTPMAISSTGRVHLKFSEETKVRLRSGSFVTLGKDDLTELLAVLQAYQGIRIERLFSRSEIALEKNQRRLEVKTGKELPDLNLWYRLIPPPGSDAQALIDRLIALPIVQTAYAEPPPAPPPDPVDFEVQQGYLDPASNGIDAEFAWTLPGGHGDGVKIIDIEYSWNQTHEDLSKAPGALIANGIPCDPFDDDNHGTAVLGEMVADDNGFGVTGIAHESALGLVNAADVPPATLCTFGNARYRLANAINIAQVNLGAGDVMLIEQQVAGPLGPCDITQVGCAPVEWVQAYFDVIQTAAADGIVVVEAAGNGATNLDHPAYLDRFDRSVRDSGAIIVGAGSAPGCTAPPRSRLAFSNYGSRVDLQGWGQCVVTAGYGGLHGGGDKNHWYTGGFGGTSSASPIVAGAAAAVQGVKLAQLGVPLNPPQVRNLLVNTGTPQDTSTDAGHIGPLPNLRQALLSTGDVSCDDVVNVVDGLFILQYEVGLRAGTDQCPLPPEPPPWLYLPACDVNDDGLCNVVDALFILQCEVGQPPGADMPFCTAGLEAFAVP